MTLVASTFDIRLDRAHADSSRVSFTLRLRANGSGGGG
jgi:hypothetical protein